MPHRTDTVIIGGGQAGLALSHCLTQAGIDHVVLERGAAGQRWRSERWTSLRLLTPNWMTRLPGLSYNGTNPEGFMERREVVQFLDRYRAFIRAPLIGGTEVREVASTGGGYRVATDRGTWQTRCVVIATGACDRPHIPAFARNLSPDIFQIAPSSYRDPGQLPDGGVMVVGASATGVQLADEIHRSGRPVTIAAGRHVRLPRLYRGRDIMAWLDGSGFLAERRPTDANPIRLRRQPSFQLVGHPDRRTLDLPALAQSGVSIVGRVRDASGTRLTLSEGLLQEMESAEVRRRRLLGLIDSYIAKMGIEAPVDPRAWEAPGCVLQAATGIELRESGIRSIVWATGYRRTYPWLNVPILDEAGEIRNDCGITPAPGLFALGLPFMAHRASTFIDGARRDAPDIAARIAATLGLPAKKAA